MTERSVGVPEKDGVLKSEYAWGPKVGSNYKSVTVDGDVFWLGDCVRYALNSKAGHTGKIVKLIEKDGKQMCRIRNFYSPSELSPASKGLEYVPEPKELFLASGDGLDVEEDILLRNIAGRSMILCTAEESFNEVPSQEQVEAADHFFRRAYDPANEEVVGLDVVEDAIGAQKLFNKKEWLLPVDKPVVRSSPQVSASKIHRHSPAVSGSSSHQGAAKGIRSSLSEVSPGSAGRKLKSRKVDKSVPEPQEVGTVKKTNKLRVPPNVTSAVSRELPHARAERLVFAIPAVSEVNPRQRPKVTPVKESKPPTSSASKAKANEPGSMGGSTFKAKANAPGRMGGSTFKAKAIEPGRMGGSTSKAKTVQSGGKDESAFKVKSIKPKGKGESMAKAKATQPEVEGESRRVSSSSIAPVGTKEGALSDVKKRKRDNIPDNEGPLKKILKPAERSNASVETENPSKVQKKAAEDTSRRNSPTVEQIPRGKIFRLKQDWDAPNLALAIQNNRVLLVENLAPGLHSDDLAEALIECFKYGCDVRMAPPESPSFRTTSALLKFATAPIAFKINESMNSRNVFVSGRLVTTSFFKYQDFKPKSSTPFGHIELPKSGRDYNNEDYRDAVATSHLAQGNTIEFDFGLPWRVLDDQHEEQWRMLQEEYNKGTVASKKMA